MQILSTPDGVADDLAGYPRSRNYASVATGDGGSMRIHYLDEGDPAGRPVVFLHGNPSWSFIWRRQVAALAARGNRVIAPDLGGMGLSDKPGELGDYTVERHVDWMRSLLFDQLDLFGITFVLHDWGGIIGLQLLAEQPDRVARVAASNTGFPWRDPSEPLPEVIEAGGPFEQFQTMAREAPVWEPWSLLGLCMETEPSDEVVAGYRAPYPDPSLTIGSRAFTQLLPTRPDNPMLPVNFQGWKVLDRFDRPVVTIFSDRDPVAPLGYVELVERIPGAKGQPHVVLEGGGHFLQEDLPTEYTAALVGWLDATD